MYFLPLSFFEKIWHRQGDGAINITRQLDQDRTIKPVFERSTGKNIKIYN